MKRLALVLAAAAALVAVQASGRADPPAPAGPAPVPAWAKVSKEQLAEAARLKVPVAFENPFGMRFVLIPSGTFVMGSPAAEAGRDADEGPQHSVDLTEAFYLSVHETTNGQWLKHTTRLPSLPEYAGQDRPVNYVSHHAASKFAKWLNEKDPEHRYALPTEAQWERACRAGTTTRYSSGDEITKEQANFGEKEGSTRKVGSFPPNAWGLHDMHGNVLEWCADWHGAYPRAVGVSLSDPSGPASGAERVLRGGSWAHEARYVRSASRHRTIPNDE